MKIKTSGKNFKLSETQHQYAQKKLNKLDRFLSQDTVVKLNTSTESTKTGEQFIVEITFSMKGNIIRAEERNSNFDMAIDRVEEKLIQRLIRLKERIIKKRRKTAGKYVVASELNNLLAADIQNDPSIIHLGHGRIVRKKHHAALYMDVEEACVQMDLLGHDFYVYKDTDTENLQIVYRRHDADYGVIIPS